MSSKKKKEYVNNKQLLASLNYLMQNIDEFRDATSCNTVQLAWRNHRESECIIELYYWLYTHVDLLRKLFSSTNNRGEIADIYESHRIIKEVHHRMIAFRLTANQAVLEQINIEKNLENNRDKFK